MNLCVLFVSCTLGIGFSRSTSSVIDHRQERLSLLTGHGELYFKSVNFPAMNHGVFASATKLDVHISR